MTRKETLDAAAKCVCGDREEDYGVPETNLGRIAEFWSIYLNILIEPKDVAAMMALLKIARIASGRSSKEDNWVDGCGYLACGCELETEGAE